MAEQTSHYHHNNGLWDFLRKRGVAEENIDPMQQDKIDTSLVREIEDAYLAHYIPVYGDRIALRRYCLDKEKQKDNRSRMSLLEKLRKKLRTATASQDEESEQEPWPARNDIDHAVHSSAHCDPPSEIQLDDAIPVFTPVEEVINGAPSTSTPVSGDHDQHTDYSSSDAGYDQHYVSLKLHRVNLLEEMICQFKDESILKYPLKFAFINERGADADAFTTALICGEHAVSTDSLFESLMLYLSQCERELITAALEGDLDSDGQDELLDLLDCLGVKTVPSQDNLKAVLLQVAHRQIIQQPKYALDNMSGAAQLLKTTITTTAKIQIMYADKKNNLQESPEAN
ncbi:hypothetical protein ABVT39_009499 [Epinephelus coioides]